MAIWGDFQGLNEVTRGGRGGRGVRGVEKLEIWDDVIYECFFRGHPKAMMTKDRQVVKGRSMAGVSYFIKVMKFL